MNLCGRFFVKSNYIRAAKDDWILCDLRMLTDDTNTFLCIKSISFNSTLVQSNEDKDSFQDVKFVSENFASRPFTALCNLSEYKSCSMKTETVNSSASFAIKLVPSSVFGNKKLLIATQDENEITNWLAVCKSCIGKKPKLCTNNKDSSSTIGTLSKAESFMSLKPSFQGNEIDFEETLLDNEVYEAYSPDEKIPATIEEIGDFLKLSLHQSECYIRLTPERLEVLDFNSYKPIHWFPYLLIRRFGAANGVLRVDAGRRCSTGDGKFFFRCSPPNGQPVESLVTQIRQLALEAKQRTKRNQNLNRNSTLDNIDQSDSKCSFAEISENKNLQFPIGSVNGETVDHGTVPRVKPKRNNKQIDAGNLDSNTTDVVNDRLPPKIISESICDISRSENATDIFKAVPYKGMNQPEESTFNVYDNLFRPPRRVSRSHNEVNVPPLPTRIRQSETSVERKINDVNNDGLTTNSNNPLYLKPVSTSVVSSNITTPLAANTLSASINLTYTNEDLNNKLNNVLDRQTSHLNKKTPSILNSTSGTDLLMTSSFKSSVSSSLYTANDFGNGAKYSSASNYIEIDTPAQNYVRSIMSPYWDKCSSESIVNSQSMLNQASSRRPSSPISSETLQWKTILSNENNHCMVNSTQQPRPPNDVTQKRISFCAPSKQHSVVNLACQDINSPTKPNSQPQSTIDVDASLGVQNKIQSDCASKHEITTINFTVCNPLKQNLCLYKQASSFNPHITTKRLNDNMSGCYTSNNMREDSRKYLTELDNVIKELCEANEAAVQATREASKKRQILEWPGTQMRTNNLVDTQIMLKNNGSNI